VAAKVALDARPAHLALVGVRVLKAVPAIGDDDPRIGADERLDCSRLQCSAIWKRAASGVLSVHSARP